MPNLKTTIRLEPTATCKPVGLWRYAQNLYRHGNATDQQTAQAIVLACLGHAVPGDVALALSLDVLTGRAEWRIEGDCVLILGPAAAPSTVSLN